MTFPGPSAIVYTNDAGEILGWDYEGPNDDPGDPYDDYDSAHGRFYADYDESDD